jgi:hypothetical protein
LLARIRDALPPQFRADALFLADKENTGAQVARRLECAFNLYGGGIVPTHCVNSDGGEHGERNYHLSFVILHLFMRNCLCATNDQ